METFKLIECPRDAWQGLPKVIPTEEKVEYLRALAEAGFRHIDAVSFVSPRHVPQMADSEKVMEALRAAWAVGPQGSRNPSAENIEIIGIVVNSKGLERALATPGVTTLGYPYSISAHFRRQNANMSLAESRSFVEELQRATTAAGRDLVIYISMAFGNPWDEPWGPEIVEDTLRWLIGIGVRAVSLADTVGTAEPKDVGDLFRSVKSVATGIELGVHLHCRPERAAEKVLAAYEAGCWRFDGALTGLGGCPFAGDELVGNIPTEIVVETLVRRGVQVGIEPDALKSVVETTAKVRGKYAAV
jgi:hydroxymethylglutaryl-CoA lyase